MGYMATTIKSPKKKAAAGVGRDGRFGMVIEPQRKIARGTTVRFGGVTVVAPKPELKEVLVSPGVRLHKTPDMPIFRADPRDASLVVRVLNGKAVRGRFIEGQFVPLSNR